MSWTERQQTMLLAMGLRVWQPKVGSSAQGLAAGTAASAAAGSVEGSISVARAAGDFVASAAARVAPADLAKGADPTPAAGAAPSAPVVPSIAVAASAAAPAALALAPMARQRGDIAAMEWSELRQAVAACTACGLCASRTQPVFGSGALRAHWLVVGEAPGEAEDLQGLPFVGRPGELLAHMLSALGLTQAESGTDESPEQRVFVVNTVKCRPPKNRNPGAEELAACEPFLLRQIELLKPRIILALGPFAIRALLRSDEPIGKLRGRLHSYQGVPVVVSYHPAYLLRQPLEKARAWEDLCLAAETAERAA